MHRQMKILIFSTVFYPAIGGIENLTLLLIREFIKKGHSVKVITQQKQSTPLEGFEVFYSPGILKSLELFRWCDVYYMPNISLKGIWLLFSNSSKRWVISHNDFSSFNKKGLLPAIKNFAIKYASQNIAVSNSVARCIKNEPRVIYNCFDNSVFRVYEEEQRVFDFVFLGRLVSQKGCDLLIKACADLKRPFTLNIIGDGPEKPYLQQLVEESGLQKQILFYGFLKDADLAKMLNRHRTMVIPSMGEEGFGIVALEGLACGCRIVAADAAGLSEAVGIYGKHFPMGNKESLINILAEELIYAETQFLQPNGQLVTLHDLNEHLKNHHKSVVADRYLSYFG